MDFWVRAPCARARVSQATNCLTWNGIRETFSNNVTLNLYTCNLAKFSKFMLRSNDKVFHASPKKERKETNMEHKAGKFHNFFIGGGNMID